jgi:tRNA-i(6)A37 thiotransferase enzyme MiaB
VARIEGIERIRFTTSHPAEFDDALIDVYARESKLAGYLHLPVQSGSDRILGMMKRGYTRAHFVERIRALRAVRPGISLSSDFIVGFPGETEEDFEQTLGLIDELQIDQAFSFIYSPRPGTPAARLRDGVSAEAKHARLDRLQQAVRAIGNRYAQGLVGSTQRVLVEKPARRGEDLIAGRTPCNRWVNFPGDTAQIGQFVDLRITAAMTNSLRGEPLAGTVQA